MDRDNKTYEVTIKQTIKARNEQEAADRCLAHIKLAVVSTTVDVEDKDTGDKRRVQAQWRIND